MKEMTFVKGHSTRVSIFMNIFDVHVNRAPLAGTVRYYHYNPGKYISAFKEKASLDNEQVALGICGQNGDKELNVLVKLIAGLIARRIVVWKGVSSEVSQGERISLIKFGSRVDVYVPPSVEIKVRVGDRGGL